ncbi:MAG: HEAT repeat domain-containing protein [Pirellulales bacterium]
MDYLSLSEHIHEGIRREFEADWIANQARPLRDYLPAATDIGYLPTLVELVCIEIEFLGRRQASRHSPDPQKPLFLLEPYLREFPELANVSLLRRLVREEWLVRTAMGEHPTVAELRARFPQLASVEDIELCPSGVEAIERSRRQSTSPPPEDQVATQDFVPRPELAANDPTLTFCVRDADGAMSIPAASRTQAASLREFADGTRVAGRYQLDRELGRGGMGRVLLAHDTRLDRPVALKVMLSPSPSRDMEEYRVWQEMFAEEARLGAGLLHPAIATVFDYGFHNGLPFAVFEYIGGLSLRDLIRRRAPLPLEDVRRIVAPLAQGLDFAHQRRVVHRDLKPENIRSTEDEQFKILDLGLAKRFDLNEDDWRFAGTPAYAAPEQAAEQPSDGRADQYALGLITYELLTGKRPFHAATVREYLKLHQHAQPPSPADVSPGLPKDVCAAVLRALAKDPHQRFATCEDFATAIGCRLMSQAALLPTSLGEQSVRVARSSFSIDWSQARRGAHLLLFPDTLWVYHRGAVRRWPLKRLDDVRRSFQGHSLQVTWRGDEAIQKEVWHFPSKSICARWEEDLRAASQQAKLTAADAPVTPARPPLMILSGRPHVAMQILGQMESRQPTRWQATASLSLRAAAAGADAVVDLIQERLFGPQRSEYRLTARPVKVSSESALVELATRWSAEQVAQITAGAGKLAGIVASLYVGLTALPRLVNWVVGASLGWPSMIMELIGEWSRGLGGPWLISLAGLFLVMAFLRILRWPQLAGVASYATRIAAFAPVLGTTASMCFLGLAPRDWHGQIQVLAESAGHLLFAVWLSDLARQLSELARHTQHLFEYRSAPRRRTLVTRCLYGVSTAFGATAAAVTAWLAFNTLTHSGSTQLLAGAIEQQFAPLQNALVERQSVVGTRESKLQLLSQLTEQSRRQNAFLPDSQSEVMVRIVSMLADPDPKVREEACHALARVRTLPIDAVNALADRLNEDAPEVRSAAFRTIETTYRDNRQAISPTLATGLRSHLLVCKRPDRAQVLTLLQKLDRQWANQPELSTFAEQLEQELTDQDHRIRLGAAELLAQLGTVGRSSIPRLTTLLTDIDMSVRMTARRALDSLEPAWQQSQVGRTYAENLLQQLSNGAWEQRIQAAESLSVLNHEWRRLEPARQAMPALLEMLAISASHQQQTVVRILDNIDADWRKTQDCSGSLEQLIERLRSNKPEERAAAISGMQMLGTAASAAIGPLLDHFLEVDLDGKLNALLVLDAIDPQWSRSPAFITRLDNVAKSARQEVRSQRVTAVRLLSRMDPGQSQSNHLLVERLADEDSAVRREAREALVRRADSVHDELLPAILAVLLVNFSNRSADETFAVSALLDRIDKDWRSNSTAVSTREKAAVLLQSDSAEERRVAVSALSVFGESARSSLPSLLPLLMDRDTRTREAALTAVQRVDPKWSATSAFHDLIPHVVQRLDDADLGVRRAALSLLAQNQGLNHTGNIWWDTWQTWMLVSSPPTVEMIRSVARKLDDPDVRTREAAASALGRLGTVASPATASLVKHLADDDVEVRRRVRWALSQLGPQWRHDPHLPSVLPRLVELLDDPQLERRLASLDALDFLGPAAASSAMRVAAALDDRDPRVQMKAIECLGKIGPLAEPALPALAKKSMSPSQRFAAEKAMSEIRADWRQILPQTDLVNALRESLLKQPSQRWEALNQLRTLGAHAESAVSEVALLLVEPDERVRIAAWEALEAIDPQWKSTAAGQQAMESMAKSLSGSNASIQLTSIQWLRRFGQRAEIARPTLLSLASHSDSRLREAALRAIGDVCKRDKDVIETLVRSLLNNSSTTRVAALASLAQIDPAWYDDPLASPVLEGWRTQLSDSRAPQRRDAIERLRSLPAPPKRIIEDMGRALHDQDSQVRIAALAALQRWGPAASAAERDLLPLLDDQTPHVRALAYSAIEAVSPNWRRRSEIADLQSRAVNRLRDPSAQARIVSVELLGRSTQGDQTQRLNLLLPFLADEDEQVHHAIANLLAQDKTPWQEHAQVPPLVTIWQTRLRDPSAAVRAGAARALGVAAPASAASLDDLIGAAADDEPGVRLAAVNALAAFKNKLTDYPEARDALINRLAESATLQAAQTMLDAYWKEWRSADSARRVATQLREQLDSEDLATRQSAISALGVLGPAAQSAMEPLLKQAVDARLHPLVWSTLNKIDPNWKQSPQALTGIQWLIGELTATESSRRILVVQALGRTNESATPALLAALKDPEIRVRVAVIEALGNLESTDALTALREQLLLPSTKRAAESAIRRIESARRKPSPSPVEAPK